MYNLVNGVAHAGPTGTDPGGFQKRVEERGLPIHFFFRERIVFYDI